MFSLYTKAIVAAAQGSDVTQHYLKMKTFEKLIFVMRSNARISYAPSILKKAAFTFILAGLFSCSEKDLIGPVKDPVNPSGPICQDPPGPNANCSPDTYVTVENVGCGVGVWRSYWLKLDNGNYLQPWVSNDSDPIEPGQRYHINYDPVQRDNFYDSVITCLAITPPADAIRINCMTQVPSL